ncbi:MAG: Trk family potassium uptake protein [Planctomycetota bacterium]|nr:MAG: Trk family potassium uptake protein [Planctomycetota bacterium]REJ90132.1 MAG: Trk family potassium uptake protein [Planctomycetota bacterium]REK30722.1 MAG: Trk family potassium uptake protein [Planctomycetota bacterium]REK33097.1 MAG: Trk family potassium uptake protein [Planctomycetota bacterium]
MTANDRDVEELLAQRSLYPARSRWLRRSDAILRTVCVAAIVVSHGVWSGRDRPWQFGAIVFLGMAFTSAEIALRYHWSLRKPTFFSRHRSHVVLAVLWTLGVLGVVILGPLIAGGAADGNGGRWHWIVRVSEWLMIVAAVSGGVKVLRTATAGGINPAVLLTSSFLFLITVGTLVLMLPRCRAQTPGVEPVGAPFLDALFTSTSASCVTGLIVVDTGTYWSRTGQAVILCLIQLGGLGIMTCGAFFAILAGRGVQLREFSTLKEIVSSEHAGSIRPVIASILILTAVAELAGAFLLSGLWADLESADRIFMSGFHSVSAFCNAGFSLTPDSFIGRSRAWEVWGVVPLLIIVGGLGFPVVWNLLRVGVRRLSRLWRRQAGSEPQPRARVSLSSKLVLVTTACLLLGGTAVIYLLELTDPDRTSATAMHPADAWFQAVTLRTAGFNTVDIDGLQPATKLLAIALMFIGASPCSTGGGVKTVVLALAVLGLLSTLRGRNSIECFGRSIPPTLTNRALAVLFVGLASVMTTTALLLLFEQRPENLLDYVFEATSAAGTVGLTTSVSTGSGDVISTTQSLSPPSRVVIVVAMFLGRIGPLTLMLALSGKVSPARYQYPEESVTLG